MSHTFYSVRHSESCFCALLSVQHWQGWTDPKEGGGGAGSSPGQYRGPLHSAELGTCSPMNTAVWQLWALPPLHCTGDPAPAVPPCDACQDVGEPSCLRMSREARSCCCVQDKTGLQWPGCLGCPRALHDMAVSWIPLLCLELQCWLVWPGSHRGHIWGSSGPSEVAGAGWLTTQQVRWSLTLGCRGCVRLCSAAPGPGRATACAQCGPGLSGMVTSPCPSASQCWQDRAWVPGASRRRWGACLQLLLGLGCCWLLTPDPHPFKLF